METVFHGKEHFENTSLYNRRDFWIKSKGRAVLIGSLRGSDKSLEIVQSRTRFIIPSGEPVSRLIKQDRRVICTCDRKPSREEEPSDSTGAGVEARRRKRRACVVHDQGSGSLSTIKWTFIFVSAAFQAVVKPPDAASLMTVCALWMALHIVNGMANMLQTKFTRWRYSK